MTESWYYTCSKNGWTSNTIALEWLERVFIPEVLIKCQHVKRSPSPAYIAGEALSDIS